MSETNDLIVNCIYGTLAVALPTVGTTIVLLWRKLIAFLKPLIEGFFESHNKAFTAQTELATEMKSQIPVVAETLKKLGDTQDKQCETQDRQCEMIQQTNKTLEHHGKILETYGQTIEVILIEVKKSNPSIETGSVGRLTPPKGGN